MKIDRPAVAELMADVSAVVAHRGAAVSEDVYRDTPGDSRSYATTSRCSRCSRPRLTCPGWWLVTSTRLRRRWSSPTGRPGRTGCGTGAPRAARIRDLLAGGRIDLAATAATLGYRLRRYHVGVAAAGDPDTFDPPAAAGVDTDVRLAFGDAAKGAAGFRLTHRQALAAQAVALAAGAHAPQAMAFGEVARTR